MPENSSAESPRGAVLELAARQDGVVSRQQATALGLDRWAVTHEIEQGRWRAHGVHSFATHRLELGDAARMQVALWEAGDCAALDGATSLKVAGLKNWTERIHLICPWPNGGRSWDGSFVHNSRLWNPDDFVVTDGMKRTRNDVATVRAAMYARTDRAAATVMAMSVQQRLTTGDRVLQEALRVNRHKRRLLILDVAHDIADGAQALSELDFAKLCRRRGLPEPSRQVVRRGPRGRVYLDVYWDDFKVVIEIEGVHHDAPENSIDDCLRQNSLTISRESVLRIPVLGLRTCPAPFMDQVEQALIAAGWRRAA
jgi:very-short-patch-repair endonuclease